MEWWRVFVLPLCFWQFIIDFIQIQHEFVSWVTNISQCEDMKNQKYLICTSFGSNLVLQSFQIGKGLSMKCFKQELTDEQFGKMFFFIQQRDVASLPFFRNLSIYCYRTHIYLYCWKLFFKPNTSLLAISFWWKMKQTIETLWLYSKKVTQRRTRIPSGSSSSILFSL